MRRDVLKLVQQRREGGAWKRQVKAEMTKCFELRPQFDQLLIILINNPIDFYTLSEGMKLVENLDDVIKKPCGHRMQ